MKLVAMLRVKNQILTLHDCLSKLSKLVDEIVIVDNGSTDGTVSAYNQYPKIVALEKTKGFHEGRDKILAHNLAKARQPDWILWTDADEIFESSTTRTQFNQYLYNSTLNKIDFRMFNFWKSKQYYRVDGVWGHYTSMPQRHMWRHGHSPRFRNLKFHNGGITRVEGKAIISPIRLKHYGYINSAQIQTKNSVYSKLKHHPRHHKTLNLSEDNIKLKRWFEFPSPIANKLWQQAQLLYWNAQDFKHQLTPK